MQTLNSNFKRPLFFVTLLFFLFGFLTCLNDILIPHLKNLFTLSFTQAMLVQVCFFSAYFFMSIPSGWFTNKKGYQSGIVTGLLISGLGTLGFIPAAQFSSYNVFLLSLFVLASGITLIQVAVNPYVTLLGSPEGASFRLNLVQAFNSLGTTIAPILGSFLILDSQNKTEAVQIPYAFLTLTLIVMAVVFYKIYLPSLSDFSNEDVPSGKSSLADYFNTIKNFPHIKKGMLAIFFYVGAEVSIGSFLVSWLSDKNVSELTLSEAGHYVALYWGGAMVGRFIGSYLTNTFKPEHVLKLFLVCILILISLSILIYKPYFSMWTMILIGFFNSIQFPVIFSLTVTDMKKETPFVSGLLCTSIVGGALIPLLQGFIADQISLRVSYILPLFCYLYILSVVNKLKKS